MRVPCTKAYENNRLLSLNKWASPEVAQDDIHALTTLRRRTRRQMQYLRLTADVRK